MTLNIPGFEAVDSALWSSFIPSRAPISLVFQRTRSIYLIKDRMDLDCSPVRGFLVGLGRPEKRAPSFEIDRQFNHQLNNCHEWLYDLSPIINTLSHMCTSYFMARHGQVIVSGHENNSVRVFSQLKIIALILALESHFAIIDQESRNSQKLGKHLLLLSTCALRNRCQQFVI
jgi:hypothetical protein